MAAGLLALGFAHLGLAVAVVFWRRIVFEIGPLSFQAADVPRLLAIVAAALAGAVALSARVRLAATRMVLGPEIWALGVLVAAWWLSLGPVPMSFGRPLELPGLYAVLVDHVPGYTGLRVPARFAMVVAFALAVLGGFGLRAVDRSRRGPVLLAAIAAVFLVEVNVLPFPVNRVTPLSALATPEPRVAPAGGAPAVYAAVRALPADAVLAELPLGSPEYDARAMYYSTLHWRPLVNGYSGFYPPRYARLLPLLSDVPGRPERAWQGLRESGATHLIVHEAAYLAGEGRRVTETLRAGGAAVLFRSGSDVLLALPAP